MPWSSFEGDVNPIFHMGIHTKQPPAMAGYGIAGRTGPFDPTAPYEDEWEIDPWTGRPRRRRMRLSPQQALDVARRYPPPAAIAPPPPMRPSQIPFRPPE